MNSSEPFPKKPVTPSPLKSIAGAIFDGVVSGVGTVVGAIEGTLEIVLPPKTKAKSVPLPDPGEEAQSAPETSTAKQSPQAKQSKSRSVKGKKLNVPKQEANRAKQTPKKALPKSKAQPDK